MRKSRKIFVVSVIFLSGIMMVPSALSASDGVVSTPDWAGYVNPFIGTVRGSGSTYPGAQVPFGMLSFSPHTEVGNHGSGYHYPQDKINGFGLVHLSGVGCGATCELPYAGYRLAVSLTYKRPECP